MAEPLTKVDSAVEEHPHAKPTAERKRRTSSVSYDVHKIEDLEKEGVEIELPVESQKTGWKINTSPKKIEDAEILDILLVKPPVKKIDLHFPLGIDVVARNIKGVTMKDAMEAIYKAYKKRSDDELPNPYLAGFEWDKEESWTRLVVHLRSDAGKTASLNTKKNKKKNKDKEEAPVLDV